MVSLLGLAIALFVLWVVLVVAFHVTAWLVHLLVVFAVIALVVWLVEYAGRRAP